MNNIEKFPEEQQRAPVHVGGNGGNGGDLTNHRLGELERRMAQIEATAKQINDLCIEMNTKLDEKASKTYVLTIFGVTGGLAVLTFIGHVMLRALFS